MWSYKIASEYIGSDAIGRGSEGNSFVQQTKVRNTENSLLPQHIEGPSPGDSGSDRPIQCPVCHSHLEDFEFQGRFLDGGEEIYRCNNCKNTNDPYKRTVEKSKKRLKRRRSFSEKNIKIATGPANFINPGYNNPVNQPYGRVDLNEEQRVVPWNRIEDGFREEFDHQDQKKNFKYKLIKVKDENGKEKYVRVRERDAEGDAVQPSNVHNEKGRIKKQPRYNPHKSKVKDKADGAWPHNRNPGTEGWYGQGNTGSNLDADMKYRVMSWQDYVSDRSSYMTNLTRPF